MQKLDVLYEDNHIIVVIKPQNVPSQADESQDEDMLSRVKAYIKEKYNKPGEVFIGLVHRLDRPTGGIMVFARNSKSAARLSEQIRLGQMDKTYYAVCKGCPKERSGRLLNFLKKDEKNNIVKIVPQLETGARKALLSYNVLDFNGKQSLLEVKIITGRSHQIRVQLAAIGCPIVGDGKYGSSITKTSRLGLWAGRLELTHPTTKERLVFVAQPEKVEPWSEFFMDKYFIR